MQPTEIEDKIGVLNRSVRTMLRAFADLDSAKGQVNVGVIVFGGESAHLHMPVTSASSAQWVDMSASGRTPMGGAFGVARSLLTDPAVMPEQAFEATLVLVSDGVPTDDWEPALNELLESPRGARAFRVSIGIGTDRMPDADEVLARFSSPEIGVLHAEQAQELPRLLQWVTATVTSTLRTGFVAPLLDDLDGIR